MLLLSAIVVEQAALANRLLRHASHPMLLCRQLFLMLSCVWPLMQHLSHGMPAQLQGHLLNAIGCYAQRGDLMGVLLLTLSVLAVFNCK